MQFTGKKNISWPCAVLHYRLNTSLCLVWHFLFSSFKPSVNPLVQILHYLSQDSFLSHIPAENPLKNVLAWVLLRSVNLLPLCTSDQWDLDSVLRWQQAITLPCGLTSWPIREAWGGWEDGRMRRDEEWVIRRLGKKQRVKMGGLEGCWTLWHFPDVTVC